MIVKYSVLNPTGNITALVETPVETKLQPAVALKIMENESAVEQVGFVNGSCLRMAGGEFCGNATMSAAALLCKKNDIESGKSSIFNLNVSGTDDAVCVEVIRNVDSGYSCTVNMPMPVSVQNVNLEFNGIVYKFPAVFFKGMTHLINEGQLDAKSAETAIRKWCIDLNSDGLGIMFFERESMMLKPLVYIPEPETLFWESSCASGTAAVGMYLAALENSPISVTLKEPAGYLSVSADGDKIFLKGCVKTVSADNRIII